MALMMPKAQASSTPRIQVKYHMIASSVQVMGVLADMLLCEPSAHDEIAPGGVAKDDGHEDAGHHEHDHQRGVTGRGIPHGQAVVGYRGGWHQEGEHADRKSTRLNSSHVRISYA